MLVEITTMPKPMNSPPGGVETIDMLASFGVQLVEGELAHTIDRLKISDIYRAQCEYVHHSRVPVAVTALAQLDPELARERWPKFRLVDLIARRPSMDGLEAVALGAVCGVDVSRTMWPRSPAPAFREHLHDLIYRRHGEVLTRFFGDYPSNPACNEITIRPRGFDWRTEELSEAEMKNWRREYRKLSAPYQMLVASILWLYRGGADKLWMHRMPCNWHAVDAIRMLKRNDMLADWGKLVALYPGW